MLIVALLLRINTLLPQFYEELTGHGTSRVNIYGSSVGSCNHIHWKGLCCGLRGLSRMCGAVYFGNTSEIWVLKTFSCCCCGELSKGAVLLSVSLPSLLPYPAQAALLSEKMEKGFGGAKEGKRREGKKLIILHSLRVILRKESDLSWASPQCVMLFSSFHANFYPHPVPHPHPAILQPQSLFLFLSLFFPPPSTSPHISVFCFYFLPCCFPW